MMIFIINIKTWVPAQRESALQSHRGSYLLSQAPKSGIIIHGDNRGRDNYWADDVVIILPELYKRRNEVIIIIDIAEDNNILPELYRREVELS